MTAPAAGWFPDPAGHPGGYRWWDGSVWTRVLTDDPAAAEPGRELLPAGAGGTDAPAGQAPVDNTAVSGRLVVPPGYEAAIRTGARTRPMTGRILLAVAAVVVTAALVMLVVVDQRSSRAELLAPPRPTVPAITPTPSVPADLTFDQAARKVTLPGLSVTMPAPPYTVAESSSPALALEQGVQATAVVQKDYDGKGNDWIAVVGVGHVPSELVGQTLTATADAVWARFVGDAFPGIPKVTQAKRTTYSDYARPVRIINADVDYHVRGVRSRYDRVSLLVTTGAGGGYVAWISSRPNAAGKPVQEALQRCIGSVRITG